MATYMGFCSIVSSVVGLILHMPITSSQLTRSRRGDISTSRVVRFVLPCFGLGGVLIADRVVVPGDLSLILLIRDAP